MEVFIKIIVRVFLKHFKFSDCGKMFKKCKKDHGCRTSLSLTVDVNIRNFNVVIHLLCLYIVIIKYLANLLVDTQSILLMNHLLHYHKFSLNVGEYQMLIKLKNREWTNKTRSWERYYYNII